MAFLLLPLETFAAAIPAIPIDLTQSWFGIASVVIFVIAYAMVINEEFLHLRKSKPVMVAAGIIWNRGAIGLQLVGGEHLVANRIA